MDRKNIIILSIIGIAIIIILLLIFIVKPFSSEPSVYPEQSFQTRVDTPDTQSVVTEEHVAEPPQVPPAKPKPVTTESDVYVVKEGETLQSIAEKLYGNNRNWYKIFTANESEIDWYDTIYVGQKLKIPASVTN
jgi:nucleoid-associated protein YgaU